MLTKIISGGQIGADVAGLDVAIEFNIEHGGWCPKGRRMSGGVIPDHYKLRETINSSYRDRTEYNVRDSDASVIFTKLPPTPGSALTIRFCIAYERPHIVMHKSFGTERAVWQLAQFLKKHTPKVLNVAGSRSYYDFTKRILEETLIKLDYEK